ncbi:MAG: phosphatidylinositol-specific phospholipase C/glycerophosphodiester phosphodiesterase family protein [Verrucomicrobiae bacterium]|nr:phosphatidylinositol-specific phospholipase C/glycerophosphodiester phosphodiesterase family protein [Verrucomicrobiae bacterium]
MNRRIAPIALLLAVVLNVAAQSPSQRAHAHNDYEHPRPLHDALEQGFGSVEADIFHIDGALLVAHDRPKVSPERTLQSLYLDPLRERVQQQGGRVHPDAPTFVLLIDFKSEAGHTYQRLQEVLADYREMLTVFRPDRTETNAVTVILSGNRPTATVAAEPERLVAIDGRLPDLEGTANPHLIPLISDNWRSHFRWNGVGTIPDEERARLHDWVERAHAQGRRIRFWAGADRPEMWRVQWEAGVDLINTDRLADLARFLEQAEAGRH